MRYPSPFLVLALVGVHTGRAFEDTAIGQQLEAELQEQEQIEAAIAARTAAAEDADPVPLSAVQGSDCETGTCADSPLEGQTVRVEAIVVGLASGGFFIQVRRRCHPYDSAIRSSIARSGADWAKQRCVWVC
jgi:hypothetical protein